MKTATGDGLTSRERGALGRAREQGWLDAGRSRNPGLLKAFGQWCWRMGIPLVWCERRSPHSRYTRVHLDMLTTGHLLTPEGRTAIAVFLRDGAISDGDAHAEWVPLAEAAPTANRLFRAAVRCGNYDLGRRRNAGSRAAVA
jgi:hypothetical protein